MYRVVAGICFSAQAKKGNFKMDGIEFFNVEMGDELSATSGYGLGFWCAVKESLKRDRAKVCGNKCPFGASEAVHPVVK